MPAENVAKLNLPQSTSQFVDRVQFERRHPGLQLDKLSPVGDGNMENQKSALIDVTRTFQDKQLLESLLAQRDNALKSLNARRLRMTTRGSLTLHLSRSGALENAGIALHPVYGFVYLPGSGIKGLVRSWAETVWAAGQPDKEKAWRKIEEAFGWGPQSERHKKGWRPSAIEAPKGAAAGRLVFHDAWPVRWPGLILDVVNNHHPKYYDGQDDPGDWEAPILVYFLAIGPGEEFEFALSDRTPTDDGLLDLAKGWLTDALTTEGAGAKTAAGYGRFKPVKGEAPIPKTLTSATYELRLASPAFLAGASQQEEDCDLRPATLRGLLRWWWRTMHAGHLDRDSLKRLETAVWGDAKSGSPVRIAVVVKDGSPELYDYKEKFQPKPEFKNQNDLQNPPNKKTTQGLFYASYGMDDHKGGRKHWYRPAGTQWSIRIDARRGWFLPDGNVPATEIAPDDILIQAVASLWLLCRFGGVGSKGRKGFGSFADIEVEGIASVENCRDRAQAFRQKCQLLDQADETCSPALEKIKTLEIETPWKNPWTALDQLGYAAQGFAQKYAHNERKTALGLPRQIHGPMDRPMHHQSRDTHKPPKELSAKKGKRHAAPIHYHLAKSDSGKLIIRATAFPAHWLPSLNESKRMLDELLSFLETELKQRVKKGANIGQHEAKPQSNPSTDLPKANERVQAELLEEKTKRGGWKAKHLDSGLEGPIQDKENAPANAKPGQSVTLTVASVKEREMAFRWAEPRQSKKTSGRNSKQGPRRGGRR